MKKLQRLLALALCVCALAALPAVSAADAEGYPASIRVMTQEERDDFEKQSAAAQYAQATAYLPKNNPGGTNGNICAPFQAQSGSVAFVLTSAPGAASYNVQLYAGAPGAGERVSDYAVVGVNNGVFFSGLTVGQDYYIKISSDTLAADGCTALYILAAAQEQQPA